MKLATYTMLMSFAFSHLAFGMDPEPSSPSDDKLSLCDGLRVSITTYNENGDLNDLSEATLFAKALAFEGNENARLLNIYIEAAFFLKYLTQKTLNDLYSICMSISNEKPSDANSKAESTVFYVLNERSLDVLIRDISVVVFAAEEKKQNRADFLFEYYMGIKKRISPELLKSVGCPDFPSVKDIEIAIAKFF